MQKPWMCCHMLSALDGGISGSFMELETTEALARSYASIRSAYQADAWIYGSATTKEFVGPYVQSGAVSACDALDLVAKKDAAHYIVSIDPLGEVGWRSPTFVRGGVEAHIIEVLSEETPAAYRGYLRAHGISYITAGAHTLDLAVAADQLFHLFSIRRALICGGGKTNWSFLQQGLVDELSLVLAPAVSAEHTASLFERMPDVPQGAVRFALNDVRRLEQDGLHLIYRVRKDM